MYMGGFTEYMIWIPETYLNEYIPANRIWSNFTTTGEYPSPRSDHCMAASEDGKTIVVFGGRVPPKPTSSGTSDFTGSLYILDVLSGNWTQGVSSSPRLYMACIIIGDQFLAWGGYDGVGTVSATPIIFDLTRRQWVQSYAAPAYYANTPETISSTGTSATSTSSSPPIPSSSSTNLPAIMGGTFGALFMIALSGLIYLCMKRKSDKVKYETLAQQRITNQAEGTNNPNTNVDKTDMGAYKHYRSNDSQTRNPQVLPSGFPYSRRDPQDAIAMGLLYKQSIHQGSQSAHYSSHMKAPAYSPSNLPNPLFVSTSYKAAPLIPTTTHFSNAFIPVMTPTSPVVLTPHAYTYYPGGEISATHAPRHLVYDPRNRASTSGSETTVVLNTGDYDTIGAILPNSHPHRTTSGSFVPGMREYTDDDGLLNSRPSTPQTPPYNWK
ncbi:hypothetical protein BC939DRAFT_267254 [Gamsiella multidivaricata]|uniref:uncharacterized protein n=1 Tax=Gamsiella multidivaricata TaxID=101098 RepID=UPI0022200E70|nr:uncharacterized protein BC939DRAFT_267254 [Gamsiella multidivaricata]KAI7819351.1 hypothetical protein BC939DRAFT_267254 [Gamsiella multidivaricata]